MRILFIEDDQEVQDLVRNALTAEGMEVCAANSASGAIELIKNFLPDLILLDQMLPGQSGIEFLTDLRLNTEFCSIPVIMVTGLSGENEQVQALEFGADDYIVKPFSSRTLVARIRAVNRRANSDTHLSCLANGNLKIDFSSHQVFVDDQPIPLTLTEFKILGELLKEHGKVLSRDNLRRRALGNLNVTDRTIDVHMASLRKKLNERGDAIETVRGIGYRFSSTG